MATKPKLVVFDHIYKCAGTTTATLFANLFKYSFNKIYIGNWPSIIPKIQKRLHDGSDVFVTGHYTYDIWNFIDADFDLFSFTFLRDPLDLVLSSWKFTSNQFCGYRVSFYHELLENSFDIMTNHIDHRGIDYALDKIKRYDAIGFVESYDESILRIAKAIGYNVESYKKMNISHQKIRMDSGLERKLRESMFDDFVLYRQARKDFGISEKSSRLVVSGSQYTEWHSNSEAHIASKKYLEVDQQLKSSESLADVAVIERRLGGAADPEILSSLLSKYNEVAVNYFLPERFPLEMTPFLVELAKKIKPYSESKSAACAVRNYEKLILFITRIYYFQRKNNSSAQYEFDKMISLCDSHADGTHVSKDFLVDYHRILRGDKQYNKAFSVIENLQNESAFNYKFLQEYAVTGCECFGYKATLNNILKATTNLNSIISEHRDLFFNSENWLPLTEVLNDTEHVVIGRFGPMFVLYDLLNMISPEHNVDLFIQASQFVDSENHNCVIRNTYNLPEGTLNPDYPCEYGSMPENAPLILVCSSVSSINMLDNAFRFFERLGFKDVYVYPFLNALLKDKAVFWR